MDSMKKRRKIWPFLAILAIVFPYFHVFATIFPNQVEAVTETQQVIFEDASYGKVEVSYVEKETAIEWKIDYQKYQDTSTNDEVQRLVKLRLEQVANGVGTVKNMNGSELMEENGWYAEKEFSAESIGALTVEMPKEVTELVVEVQMDEQRATNQQSATETLTPEENLTLETEAAEIIVEENVLPSEAAGPHRIEAAVEEVSSEEEAVPENSTPNEEQTTQSSEEETESTENQISDEESPISAFLPNTNILRRNIMRQAVSDPFKYYDAENPTGIYPKHWSDSHLDGDTSENIRNYDYSTLTQTPEAQDEVQMFSITGDPMNFASGYHEYGNEESGQINTKKTVTPTDQDNIFQIQLDTIGDAIRPIPKVDVVLVLDKSSSMNEATLPRSTRWKDLQAAVDTFAEKMLTDYHDVQIGMAAFGSYNAGLYSGNRPYGEIASFSNLGTGTSMPTSMTGFTTNKEQLMGHDMISSADAPTSSGTPTFLGVDAGLKLLTTSEFGARPDAEKVLITITDGIPTFRPQSGYMTSTTPLDTSLNRLDKSRQSNGSVLRMVAVNPILGSNLYAGDGTSSTVNDAANSSETINFINTRYGQFANSDIKRYAVGFHTGDAANAVVSVLGQDGAFKASSIQDLISALSGALAPLISTISNGIITDPLSEFVNLVSGTVQYSALTLNGETLTEIASTDTSYPHYALAINDDSTGRELIFSNVNLGLADNARQGFRITYKVELNEEHHDGKFYPTNKTTFLTNGDGTNIYYAVPSVKRTLPEAPVRDFTLTKKITGTESVLAGAKFALFENEMDEDSLYESTFSNEEGLISFTEIVPGEYWLKEIETPAGFKTMEPIQIAVDEDGVVTFDGKELTNVYNDLKNVNLTLNKKGNDGTSPLKGAVFELRDAEEETKYTFYESEKNDGQHTLKDVAPGEYRLVEAAAPNGYRLLGEIGTLIISEKGDITFTEKESGNGVAIEIDKEKDTIEVMLPDVVNNLKPFELSILKKSSANGQLLSGAEFRLYEDENAEGTVLATAMTDEQGIGTFNPFTLEAGKTYYVKETAAPEGFILLDGIFTVEVSIDGLVTVSYDGNNLAEDAVKTGFASEGDNNTIQFTVENDQKGQLPATGGPGRKSSMFTAAAFIVFAIITTAYYVYRNRKGAK